MGPRKRTPVLTLFKPPPTKSSASTENHLRSFLGRCREAAGVVYFEGLPSIYLANAGSFWTLEACH